MIITMALHPTGHVAAAQLDQTIRMLIFVRTLALACIPCNLGAWGLSRRGQYARLNIVGLVLCLQGQRDRYRARGACHSQRTERIVASAGSRATSDVADVFALTFS